MFLNNYYQWLNAITHNTIKGNGDNIVPVSMLDYYKTDVTQIDCYAFEESSSGYSNNNIKVAGQAYIASDIDEPTKGDWNFSNPITNVQDLSYTFANAYVAGRGVVRTITITGTAPSALTIRQVGYGKKITKAYNSVTAYPCLFAKWVLPEPLAVAAGEGFSITVEWVEGEASN